MASGQASGQDPDTGGDQCAGGDHARQRANPVRVYGVRYLFGTRAPDTLRWQESTMVALDPAGVESSAQLATALDQLRGSRSLRELEKAAKELSPTRSGRALVL